MFAKLCLVFFIFSVTPLFAPVTANDQKYRENSLPIKINLLADIPKASVELPEFFYTDVIEIFKEHRLATMNFCGLFAQFGIPERIGYIYDSKISFDAHAVRHVAGLIDTWENKGTKIKIARFLDHIHGIYPEYDKLASDLVVYIIKTYRQTK